MINVLQQALAFVERVTHWQEGSPDKHDTLVSLRAAIAAQGVPVADKPANLPYKIMPVTENFKSGDRLTFIVETAQPLPVTLCIFLQSQPSGPEGNFMFGQFDTVSGSLSENVMITQPVQAVWTDIVFTDQNRMFERKFKILLKPELRSPVSEAVGASKVLTLPAPTATYTIQRIDPEGDRRTLWRGKEVTYAVTAQNLPGGRGMIYVTIDGGRVSPSDILEGAISAPVYIDNRKALLIFSTTNLGYGDLPFTLSLRTGSITGPIVAQCIDQVIRRAE